jgi:sensor c-di-GMP phosphodiesterase-like protein
VSEVKIHSSFIARLRDSADDEAIVQSIVDLVRALGIDSVAEGVESEQIATTLRAMGCQAAQGWYFSKPLTPASATAWLAEHGVASQRPGRLRSGHGAIGRAAAGRPVISPTGLSAARPPGG